MTWLDVIELDALDQAKTGPAKKTVADLIHIYRVLLDGDPRLGVEPPPQLRKAWRLALRRLGRRALPPR